MAGGKSRALYRELAKEIADGRFAPLGAFPSEHMLSKRYEVSRETVRCAKKMLEDAGLVYTRRGCGTFVSGDDRDRRSIGVLVSGCRYAEIFSRIGRTIEELAKGSGLGVVMGDASCLDTEKTPARALDVARRFVDAGVAGVIVQPVEFVPNADAVNTRIASLFDNARVPVVLFDCDVVSPPARSAYDRVGVDNFDAGRRVGWHLAEMGARAVLCCASPNSPESVRSRFAGVRAAFGGAQLLESAPTDVARFRRALREHPEIDAVVCQNDVYAVSAMACLRRLGRRIPEDVMVAGFDDLALAKACGQGLTSVAQPCEDIAAVAFERLRRRMAGDPLPPMDVNLPTRLVVRGSTARRAQG